MSIVNHHEFKLYDDSIGKTEIDFSNLIDKKNNKELKLMAKVVLGTTNINWPIMSLDNMESYFNGFEEESEYLGLVADRLKDGQLILNNY